MDATSDPIKDLIETTGWSCDDILQKLLEYKNKNNKSSEKSKVTHPEHCTGNEYQKQETDRDNQGKIGNVGVHAENIRNSFDNIGDQPKFINGCEEHDEHHEQVSEVAKETNGVSGSMGTTLENIPMDFEHKKKTSGIDLISAPFESNKNLEIPVPNKCKNKYSESKFELEDEKLEKAPSKKHQGVSQVFKDTNIASISVETLTENVSVNLEHEENVQSVNLKSEIYNSNKQFVTFESNKCDAMNRDIQVDEKEDKELEESYSENQTEVSQRSSENLSAGQKAPLNSHENISLKQSISDKLVQMFKNKLENEKSGKSGNDESPTENVIEVCQLEDTEMSPNMPLLKLRSDLFAENCNGNFIPSDNEAENEETSPEVKEFLKNIEEVTAEVDIHYNSKIPLHCNSADTVKTNALRKVKMGFVKKRKETEQTAMKYINNVGLRKIHQVKHNEIFSIQAEGLYCDNDSLRTNSVTEEEVRKSLKLQLNSLRNRKKTSNLFVEKYKIGDLKITYDKKKVLNSLASQPLTSTTFEQTSNEAIVPEKISEEKVGLKHDKSGTSLFSVSSDTNFMIVDVQGGVEDPDVSRTLENPTNIPSDLIKLTKTNDVTKIKGWQNKKFQMSQEDNSKDSTEIKIVVDDSSKPSCSEKEYDKGQSVNIKKGELSPFVSNTLEEFLTENSRLNISYNIPKLGAEEAINTQKYNTVIIPQTENYDSDKKDEFENIEKPKTVKPKTLAEKRRMLERSKCKDENKEMKFSKDSFVLYNGQKLYVPTTTSKECLVNINFTPKSSDHKESINHTKKNKKMSLLDLYHQKNTTISYKPGPLQKKYRLQNKESTSTWHTETRKLPAVKLNIVPEVGKPVPPHLVHFFTFDPKIKKGHLEFALSALTNKKQEKQGFRLTVPYANKQKYILVRKKNSLPCQKIYDIPPEKNTVKSVLDDIISYVENKEIEDSIIKDSEVYVEEDPVVLRETNSSSGVGYVKKSKRRKLDAELLRLSCKVLSVSVDEMEEDVMIKCNKSFCRLGCVCRSLTCTARLPMHCTKLDCLFECKCSTSMDISLEGNALTCDAVTRLEDQAKRNLARVEKEFTQTIIHTNDKTILIPSSDRNKTKRIKRMPKRYSDFLEDFDVEDNVSSSIKESKENNPAKITNCSVRLPKLDLKEIIPLCLYHNQYNCACIFNNNKKSNPSSDMERTDVAQHRGIKRKKWSIKKKEVISKTKEASDSNHSGYNTSDSEYMEELRIVDSRKFKQKGGCARVFGVHPEVLARNEIPFYKNKLKSKVNQTENFVSFDTTRLQDFQYIEPLTKIIDVTTPLQISASDRLKLFIMKKHNYKRKSSTDNIEIDRPKRLKKPITEDSHCDSKKVGTISCTPVFDGEIIVPTNENKDFVKKLGVKSAAAYMRLLPWSDLLRNYYEKKINIWCPHNSNKNMVLNVTEKGPPPGYIEITESKRKNGIMNWILSKELPNNTPTKLVHLILSPKNEYFEISGICLKNITEEEKGEKYIDYKKVEKNQLEPSSVPEQISINNNGSHFTHKNHNNEVNLLVMIHQNYKKKEFYEMSDTLQLTDRASPIYVGLPTFEKLQWRMVFLNSNFTFLSFVKNDYFIKYTDLMNIMKQAQDVNKTIFLQSKKLCKGYGQRHYGIYAVPEFADRLFIGPYQIHEHHGLQTFRYLKQSLVPTEYFEKIQGGVLPNKKKDKWLLSKSLYCRLRMSKKSNNSSVDITSKPSTADQEYAVLTPLPSASCWENKTYLKHAEELQNWNSQFLDERGSFVTSLDLETNSFIKFPDFKILNHKKIKKQDYNCFLMTNIPGFGYLGAVKFEETDAIEVNWPFGTKVLRFTNVLYAVKFIQGRFNNLLVPIPSTFNIRIILREDIDNLRSLSPVDPKLLNGTHLCGTFGILDSRKLTSDLAYTLGTTQEEVLQMLTKRAQFLVSSRLTTLGLLLLPKDEPLDEVLDNVAHLLKLGKLEIERLKAHEHTLIETKKKLIAQKQNNLKKYMELLKIFPEERRIKEYSKLREELNNTNILTEDPKNSEDVIECIEISDSDSEDQSKEKLTEPIKCKETSPNTPVIMKSILKAGGTPSQVIPSTSSDNKKLRPMNNFKLMKTSSGKLVVVKDNSGGSLSRSLTGMKMKISNNKILDIQTE